MSEMSETAQPEEKESEINMSKLTPYESARLQTLASKAGITLPNVPALRVQLRNKEIAKIEKALTKAAGSAIVIVRKHSSTRVFSIDRHRSLVNQGKKIGGSRWKKGEANANSTN